MSKNTEFQQEEIFSLNGVYYSSFVRNGQLWRLGSIASAWPQELAFLGSTPSEENLLKSEAKGIWLKHMANTPALAVMCCGLGAAWPGMGRGLYDNFPACRDAMDKLAALADWDLLALMDETDLETINQTRLQIPYLFMLEYAQWSQFVSLGLKPALMSGHSLGELVALCFAGVYDVETAWHLLDTRSEHIAVLEKELANQGGMLAIAGDFSAAEKIMPDYPYVCIANRNTPKQHILSGPRSDLLAIRKILRRNHIPAIMLNMNLAFHNPGMRVLRELAVRRLNDLAMKEAAIPMLSCVRQELYPPDQKDICDWIADLDENTVDWVGSLEAMKNIFHIKAYLELGPQEILCGLVRENLDKPVVMAACRKDKEVETLREACARLYSLGLLDSAKIRELSYKKFAPGQTERPVPAPGRASTEPAVFTVDASAMKALEALAALTSWRIEDLRPELDLRHDLAMRSSRFPLFVQELENKLQRRIKPELLFNLSTVGDLLRLFADKEERPAKDEKGFITLTTLPHYYRDGSLIFHDCEDNVISDCRQKGVRRISAGHTIIAAIFDENLMPGICVDLAATACRLIIPDYLLKRCGLLAQMGASLLGLRCDSQPTLEQWEKALRLFVMEYGFPDGLIFMPRPQSSANLANKMEIWRQYMLSAANLLKSDDEAPWFCQIYRILPDSDASYNYSLALGDDGRLPCGAMSHGDLRVIWHDAAKNPDAALVAADALIRSLHGLQDGTFVWQSNAQAANQAQKVWLAAPANFLPYGFENSLDYRVYDAYCQFSEYAEPALTEHGRALFLEPSLPDLHRDSPYLSCGRMLAALTGAAKGVYPWLHAAGLSDMTFVNILAIPKGVTRECSLHVYVRPWLELEKVQTRMMKVEMAARMLADNGRALEKYEEISTGTALLTVKPVELAPIWQHLTAAGEYFLERSEDFFLQSGFRDALPSIKSIRKIVMTLADKSRISAYMMKMDIQSFIADNENWSYNFFSQIIDKAILAIRAILCLDIFGADALAETFAAWKLAVIGHVRFASSLDVDLDKSDISVIINCSWRESTRLRFNVQAENACGKPILTMYHMEFLKNHRQNRSDAS